MLEALNLNDSACSALRSFLRMPVIQEESKLALCQGNGPDVCKLLVSQVVKFGGGNKGQPAREILDNPCAEHFILFQIGCALSVCPCIAVKLPAVADWSHGSTAVLADATR